MPFGKKRTAPRPASIASLEMPRRDACSGFLHPWASF